MLIRTQDNNDEVALEACEFWLAYAELPSEVLTMLQPFLARSVLVGGTAIARIVRYAERGCGTAGSPNVVSILVSNVASIPPHISCVV